MEEPASSPAFEALMKALKEIVSSAPEDIADAIRGRQNIIPKPTPPTV